MHRSRFAGNIIDCETDDIEAEVLRQQTTSLSKPPTVGTTSHFPVQLFPGGLRALATKFGGEKANEKADERTFGCKPEG